MSRRHVSAAVAALLAGTAVHAQAQVIPTATSAGVATPALPQAAPYWRRAAIAAPAWNKHEPRPGVKDSTIRTLPYDPAVTIYLTSTDLSPVELVVAPGEHRVMVAGARLTQDPSKATDWYEHDNNNIIIFQPLKQMVPSVGFLQTETAEGETRHYTILLHTRVGDVSDVSDKDNYSEVDMVYPHTATPAELAAQRARRDAAEERAAHERLVQDQFTVPRNRDYSPQGKDCPALMPKDMSDDSHFTTLLFSPGQALPNVVWYEAATKAEHKLSPDPETTQAGVLITVTGVYKELRLRSDDQVCALHNNAYHLPATMPGDNSGTSSPFVVREVRGP